LAKKAVQAEHGEVQSQVMEGGIQFTVDPKAYPLDLVYQAAFVFIDNYYCYLDRDADGLWQVSLKGKEPLAAEELTRVEGEFRNELLAQAVRATVAKQSGKVREMIVAKALWGAGGVRPGEAAVPTGKPDDGKRGQVDYSAQKEQEELDRLLAEIEADFEQDPMGIAVPWDEKYGKEGGPGKKEEGQAGGASATKDEPEKTS